MTVTRETETEILRLFHAEKWRCNTIARQLNIHHSTVSRVLQRNGVGLERLSTRRSMADPYLPFMRSVLEKYPKLTASRLYEMVKMRGYPGGVDHFRDIVARHRPRAAAEAYLRLKTLPGEQAQVDWAHFGKIRIGNAERPLFGFVMVLSWSRHIFLRFYTGLATTNFLQAHVDSFRAFGGVPRDILYDNLKSAVLERVGTAIRFNPVLLELAGYYKFAPKPVAVARGNEKGRVERAIRYIRDSFFAARQWASLEDLNSQAEAWCTQTAAARKCAEDREMTVAEAHGKEKSSLLALPDEPFPAYERCVATVGKTPYVRFDLNDYSVPHEYVRRQLTVVADRELVRVVDGLTEVARHPRCYEKGKQIEQPEHIGELKEWKRRAKKGSGMNRLFSAAPSSRLLLERAAERGGNIGGMTAKLLSLLDLYGATELEASIQSVLQSGASHVSAVSQELERRRRQRGLRSPVAITLPVDRRLEDLVVRPHALASYDELSPKGDDQ